MQFVHWRICGLAILISPVRSIGKMHFQDRPLSLILGIGPIIRKSQLVREVMPNSVLYDAEAGVIAIRIQSRIDESVMRELASEVARIVNEHSCFLVLNDAREATLGLSTVEIYRVYQGLWYTVRSKTKGANRNATLHKRTR